FLPLFQQVGDLRKILGLLTAKTSASRKAPAATTVAIAIKSRPRCPLGVGCCRGWGPNLRSRVHGATLDAFCGNQRLSFSLCLFQFLVFGGRIIYIFGVGYFEGFLRNRLGRKSRLPAAIFLRRGDLPRWLYEVGCSRRFFLHLFEGSVF